ncbi:MAG TPA: GAF domain-containing SpoIIE family protein phosphatase [Thermoleophilaceae bacterium]|jgi:serine phosphatase RsbU (regulator of sigma subunit)
MGRLAALEEALVSLVIRRDVEGLRSSPTFQRALGMLFVAGATIGTVSMVFPQPPGTSIAGLFVLFGIAYVVGAVLLLGRGALPVWSNHVALTSGTVLITLAIHFTDERTSVYSMFYLWVSITAFYFFSWRAGWAQIAIIAAAFSVTLVAEKPPAGEEQWVITLGTVVVAGLFVGTLRRGVERLIAEIEEAHRTDHARLYAAERKARLEADRASESLKRLQAVTDVALSHLKLTDLLDELLNRVTEMLDVDFAAIVLADADETFHLGASRGLPPALGDLRMRVGEGFVGRVAEARRPIVLEQVRDTDVIPPLRGSGMQSLLGVPLIVEGRVTGVMPLGSYTRRAFTPEEVRVTQLAADRMAVAIENARLYEREHRIAETLQRSLLPNTLPSVAGLDVAARYLPARAEAQVGGDWYDVVELAGGGLALSIGDVAGHGIEAAALMGQLRNALRGAALEGEDAASAMMRVDRLLQSQRERQDTIATAVFARINGDGARLEMSSAGHPPPLIVHPDGSTEYIENVRAVPLGVPAPGGRRSSSCRLEPGSLLLLYTDGLVERRGASLTHGLDRLAEAAAGAAGRDPEQACDSVVAAMLGDEGGAGDDVALLAVAVGPR